MNFWVWCLGLNISSTLHYKERHISLQIIKTIIPLFQKSITKTTPRLSRLLLRVSEFDVLLHYQPGLRMKLSDALSRQSSYNIDDQKFCKVKGLDISVHEIDVNVSGCKLNHIHEEIQR